MKLIGNNSINNDIQKISILNAMCYQVKSTITDFFKSIDKNEFINTSMQIIPADEIDHIEYKKVKNISAPLIYTTYNSYSIGNKKPHFYLNNLFLDVKNNYHIKLNPDSRSFETCDIYNIYLIKDTVYALNNINLLDLSIPIKNKLGGKSLWTFGVVYTIFNINLVNRLLLEKMANKNYSIKEARKFYKTKLGILLPYVFTFFLLHDSYGRTIYSDFSVPFDINFITYSLFNNTKDVIFKNALDPNIKIIHNYHDVEELQKRLMTELIPSKYPIFKRQTSFNFLSNRISTRVLERLEKRKPMLDKLLKLANAKLNNRYEEEKYRINLFNEGIDF